MMILLEKFIPIIGTLCGVTIGSCLTYFLANKREIKKVNRLKSSLWGELEYIRKQNLDLLSALIREKTTLDKKYELKYICQPMLIDMEYINNLQKELSGYVEKEVREVIRFIENYSALLNREVIRKNEANTNGEIDSFYFHICRCIIESCKLNFHLDESIKTQTNSSFDCNLTIEDIILKSVEQAELEQEFTIDDVTYLFEICPKNI
ncbi:hypothetical protein [Vibrio cincinnatiensis]|uniref:hypothetical protein n=1 Tax=Vibrio cincinnatiensis TaxID=675 RepID=UPI001EE01DED|nr:hypothetical protein [Vibrio cincinnatiensis]MCG3727401.1 hypothetical protein [Vibrio cincinnatiensis]